MRKALIAAIVATALFAVGAFAAQFTVSAEDVASGSDGVIACAEYVDVDFDDATPTGTNGDYVVEGATLRFYDGFGADAEPATDCDEFDAEVAIGTGDSATASLTFTPYTPSAPIDGEEATVEFGPISVASIHAASVLVDGKTLTADLVAAP
jgi:hypothetical protein